MKRIVIEVLEEKDYDETMSILESSFKIAKKDFLETGERFLVVKPRSNTRRVRYTEEQVKGIVQAYREFLSKIDKGEQVTWFHVREGKPFGLTKRQILAILESEGIYRSELHSTHNRKEK